MAGKFQDIADVTAADVDDALRRNDPDELRLVSLTLALSDLDHLLVQEVCIRLCAHPVGTVRAHAFISLGYLARRYRRLDEPSVKPLVERALHDPDEYVRLHAHAAAEEIHQFLHWQIAGHEYGQPAGDTSGS